ncbi:gluconolactonase [bacterium]|nr:gluconolactonase [bacterium]
MRRIFCSLVVLFTAVGSSFAADDYQLGPDSQIQPGVPQGQIKGPFKWNQSQIFPGTEREYWIYVPAQYDAAKPACVMVFQDGGGFVDRKGGWRVPVVFDNLIARKEMPVTIGIFINPGVVPAPNPNAEARYNRSFEYDALGDRYARFLIEEILPEVAKSYNLSKDPNDYAIGGASSGAICAFNVAWERPDAFRRVFSCVGTFVGLRGGNEFPVLVRKMEAKPIRVFLQDGSNDLNIYAGSWWVAAQDMLSALTWAGYDVNHAWGDGGHNGKHGAAVLPDALRWLWRDYPKPIEVGTSGAKRRMDTLIPGENWQLVSEGHQFTEGPAVNEKGEVFFSDLRESKIFKIGLDGKVTLFASDTGEANGLTFGVDGRLYACANGSKQIVAYDMDGDREVIIEDVNSNDCLATQDGGYFTDPTNKRVYFVNAAGEARVVDEGIAFPNGIALSPDRTLLYVADTRGGFVYSFQAQPDGSLKYKQEFFHLHVPYGATDSGADGMTVDTEGHLYVATRMGVQVCDQPGRVNLIISKPQNAWLSNVVFGGPKLDELYATCGDKVFKRRINAKGVISWQDPIKPPKPGL